MITILKKKTQLKNLPSLSSTGSHSRVCNWHGFSWKEGKALFMHGRPARGESLFLGVWQFWVEGNSGYQHFPLSFSQATFGVIFKRHNYLTPDLCKRSSPPKSLSGTHWSSCENPHLSVHSKDTDFICNYQRGFFIPEKWSVSSLLLKWCFCLGRHCYDIHTYIFSISHFQHLLCPIDISTGWREET